MLASAHQQNSQISTNGNKEIEHKIFQEKCGIYLKLISEATRMTANNSGTYRREIWDYLLKHYGCEEDTVEYRDFLLSIKFLSQQGKIISNQGLFHVEPHTFQEIW